MSRGNLVTSISPRDADAPGYYDLDLDIAKVLRRLAGDPHLARLRVKHRATGAAILRMLTPGAHRDAKTGRVTLNNGYDPAHDEGALEGAIWTLVAGEVGRMLSHAAKPRVP